MDTLRSTTFTATTCLLRQLVSKKETICSTLAVQIRREFSAPGGSNSSTTPVDTLGALRSHWRYKDFNPIEERNLKVNLSRSFNFDYTAV